VRLAAFLRFQQLASAVLWLRAITTGLDADDDADDGISEFERVDVSGTGPWQRYEIVMDVPGGADSIQFGIEQQGTGTLWAAHFSFEQVSSSVALTARKKPENLDFVKSQNGN